MRRSDETYDVVVCGGGLAGLCAAIAAARQGARTCLIHDRPVLGGNASSEIRVTVHGAACFHAYARETGIVSELLIEERARNHETINENGWVNSVLDLVAYDAVQREPNLTLHLNTAVVDVLLDGDVSARAREAARPQPETASHGWWWRPACAEALRIAAVATRTAGAEIERIIRGRLFVDATGDAVVADGAGCAWRMGSEGRGQTGEPHAPEQPSTDTMGNSIHIRCRDTGRDAPFVPPPWAVQHADPAYFYEQGRVPHDPRGGFWWIEIGMPWHTIHDNETIRHQLTRHALGIWDWMKNRDPKMMEKCRTYALDWIGQVPGKRESRRVMGLHLLTEHDLLAGVRFPDEVAFGGWFIDLHTPGGLLAGSSEPASAEQYKPDSAYAAKSYVGPYGIPLRSLIARDVGNLLLAGRDISATHAALGTARVMATTALMGQAVGTAAAVALAAGIDDAHALAARAELVASVQQRLLRDGCFLPGIANRDPADLARRATASASSAALLHGAAPGDRRATGGQLHDEPRTAIRLDRILAQWIAIDGARIARLRICIDQLGATTARIPVRLVRVDGIWDYRLDRPVVAQATLDASPGEGRWLTWELDADPGPPGYLRLDVGPAPDASWRICNAIPPGCVAGFQMSADRLRRQSDSVAFGFRIDPPQSVYAPAEVLTGVTRPHGRANLWRSDPGQPMPQWLELAWPEPTAIACVELTFAGHLLREIHAEPAFFRDAQTVRDYRIEAETADGWTTLARASGNYQRHRRHVLPAAVAVRRLRLVVDATNGDPSAAVYEIRAY